MYSASKSTNVERPKRGDSEMHRSVHSALATLEWGALQFKIVIFSQPHHVQKGCDGRSRIWTLRAAS